MRAADFSLAAGQGGVVLAAWQFGAAALNGDEDALSLISEPSRYALTSNQEADKRVAKFLKSHMYTRTDDGGVNDRYSQSQGRERGIFGQLPRTTGVDEKVEIMRTSRDIKKTRGVGKHVDERHHSL